MWHGAWGVWGIEWCDARHGEGRVDRWSIVCPRAKIREGVVLILD
jgi:hypothetical protein